MTNVPNDRTEAKLNALSEAVRALTAELTLERVLRRLSEITARLINARYAALGVPNDSGGLDQFYTYGMTEKQIDHMDHYPLGRGLLGLLVARPEAIRLDDMHDDERSAGFCANHPKMTSFLGVPIMSKGKHLGSLYLSDRVDGQPFSEDDERMVSLLASHAAIAIENAQLYDELSKLAIIKERDRISMELHDGIIQAIYAIGIKLELTRLNLENREGAETQIISANQDLNHVIEDLRRYIQDLRTGVDLSLAAHERLNELAEGFREVSPARLVMDLAQGFTRLDEAKLHTIVQISREAFSNIVRHSKATEVYLDLHESGGHLNLVISDDGTGFDVGRDSTGNGLHNMRQRVRQLGGSMQIVSQINRGTTLTVTF